MAARADRYDGAVESGNPGFGAPLDTGHQTSLYCTYIVVMADFGEAYRGCGDIRERGCLWDMG